MRSVGTVVKDLLLDVIVLVVATTEQRLARALRPIVITVRLLDPPIHQEPQHVGGKIERQHDEVEQVVVVEQIDAYS